ncbi:hypothetical protein LQ236_001239 [Nitrospina gracilis]|nr:hypothetical protein [Nitrospina sp. Nb-3]
MTGSALHEKARPPVIRGPGFHLDGYKSAGGVIRL